jgi:integrase
MSSLPFKDSNPQPSKVGLRVRSDGVLETLDGREVEIAEAGPADFLFATGEDARRLHGDLAELHALRHKRAGGRVFKRRRSPHWQIRYLVGGKWRDESIPTAKSRRDAEWWLTQRVFEASAGTLPGTASFEQTIERLLDADKVRGLKSVARMARAGKALRARFEGSRAEQIDGGAWRKFAMERLQQAAPDTVSYELSIAKRAYRLARADGLLRSIPEFPPIKNLRVRRGFIEAKPWRALRERLQPDFRDAADFRVLTGARPMETLLVGWSDVELDARVIHLRHTKTDVPRAIPFGRYPTLEALVARRLAVRRALERAGVITPWFFCFGKAALRRPAGSPLFERANRKSGERGLCKALRKQWRAAAVAVGHPGLLFHDLRRTSVRFLERSIPDSSARALVGHTERFRTRYAIGAERDFEFALPALDAYLRESGWHFGGTAEKSPSKSRRLVGGDGRSRTYDTADMSRML